MTEKWVRDTGLVFALVALFFAYRGVPLGIPVAALLVAFAAFAPSLLRPLAYAWSKLAQMLAFVGNRIFFGLVFFLIITPIALVRRTLFGDLRDRGARKKSVSAFVDRTQHIQSSDLVKPY